MIAMSVQNASLILHSLSHQSETGMLADTWSQDPIAGDEVLELGLMLHQIFQQKSNRSYACFADAEVASDSEAKQEPFPVLLHSYMRGDLDFVEFAKQASEILVASVNKYELICEGYLYYIRYQYVGVDYLMIGIFESEESVNINEKFALEKVKYIDLNKMGLVARVDLTQYKTSPEQKRYISFIKGRAGRKVADFFLEFLSAAEGIDQKLQNETLIRAIGTYAAEHQLPQADLLAAKTEMQSYCRSQLKQGDDLEAKTLSDMMPAATGQDFYSYLTEEVGLPDNFPPSATALRAMTKFVGSGGGLTISFDQKLLGDRIRYDESNDTLTIVGMPPNLKDQLLRSK